MSLIKCKTRRRNNCKEGEPQCRGNTERQFPQNIRARVYRENLFFNAYLAL